ncbi:MAG: ABC transporter permease, partial [Oscillospiraceae bacterium]
MKTKLVNRAKSLTVPLILLGIWWVGSNSGIWSAYVLPSPPKVFSAFVTMLKSGEMLQNITASLSRVLIGFSIAFVLAFCMGVLAGISPKKAVYYNSVVEF